MKIEFGKKAQIIIALLLLTGAAGAIAEYGNNINIPGNFTGLNGIFSGDISANDITVSGTVDGVDIASSINQGVRTTDSPTFNNIVVSGNVDGVDISASINQGVRTSDSPSFVGLNATDINADKIGGVIYADQYATIQAAINASSALGGGDVYVKAGNYNECLTIYNNVNLKGAGSGYGGGVSTNISCTGTAITMDSLSSSTISGLRIWGGDYTTPSNIGINMTMVDKGVTIRDVSIDNEYYGIVQDGSYLNHYENIRISGSGTTRGTIGIYMKSTSGRINSPFLQDILIGDLVSDGIRAENANGVYAVGVQIVNVGGDCINITGDPTQTSGPNTFIGIAADNCGKAGINISKGSASDSRYMQFIAPWVTHAEYGIIVNQSYDIFFSAPIIEFITKDAVVIDGSIENIFSGGTILGWDTGNTGLYSGVKYINNAENNIFSSMEIRAVNNIVNYSIDETYGFKNNYNTIKYDRSFILGSYSPFLGTNTTTGLTIDRSQGGVTNHGGLSAAPTPFSAGDKYFDTDVNYWCYYNSTTWVDISTGLVICS